eukprot:GFYU01007911.1.p1 GENE.GFYU01007911.1~~GFYU01007911.1.p1  ORF type:complete len:684 (-),score=123.18 GFYU01007911.1:207-2258(-)
MSYLREMQRKEGLQLYAGELKNLGYQRFLRERDETAKHIQNSSPMCRISSEYDATTYPVQGQFFIGSKTKTSPLQQIFHYYATSTSAGQQYGLRSVSFDQIKHALETVSLTEATYLFEDYGIVPQLLSMKELAHIFRVVNMSGPMADENLFDLNFKEFQELLVRVALVAFHRDTAVDGKLEGNERTAQECVEQMILRLELDHPGRVRKRIDMYKHDTRKVVQGSRNPQKVALGLRSQSVFQKSDDAIEFTGQTDTGAGGGSGLLRKSKMHLKTNIHEHRDDVIYDTPDAAGRRFSSIVASVKRQDSSSKLRRGSGIPPASPRSGSIMAGSDSDGDRPMSPTSKMKGVAFRLSLTALTKEGRRASLVAPNGKVFKVQTDFSPRAPDTARPQSPRPNWRGTATIGRAESGPAMLTDRPASAAGMMMSPSAEEEDRVGATRGKYKKTEYSLAGEVVLAGPSFEPDLLALLRPYRALEYQRMHKGEPVWEPLGGPSVFMGRVKAGRKHMFRLVLENCFYTPIRIDASATGFGMDLTFVRKPFCHGLKTNLKVTAQFDIPGEYNGIIHLSVETTDVTHRKYEVDLPVYAKVIEGESVWTKYLDSDPYATKIERTGLRRPTNDEVKHWEEKFRATRSARPASSLSNRGESPRGSPSPQPTWRTQGRQIFPKSMSNRNLQMPARPVTSMQ